MRLKKSSCTRAPNDGINKASCSESADSSNNPIPDETVQNPCMYPSDKVLRNFIAPFVLLILLGIFALVLYRSAWLCDDAYITFRTVDNFINGYGLRYNTGERVQAYTHPLWLLLLSMDEEVIAAIKPRFPKSLLAMMDYEGLLPGPSTFSVPVRARRNGYTAIRIMPTENLREISILEMKLAAGLRIANQEVLGEHTLLYFGFDVE